jgi:enoyl-CoA hydratase
MSDQEIVLYEVKDNIAYVTLNRPERQNRLNIELCKGLGKSWKSFAEDPDAKVAILSANGDDFSYGADLSVKGLLEYLGLAFPANGTEILKPIIAAVHGQVIGSGYGVATHGTDITIAAEDTQFVFYEPKVGIVGAVMEYAPYMPFKIGLEFYLTGEPMSAQRAYEVGLVNKVVPKKDLMNEAMRYANILKKNAPLSLRAIKYGQYKIMDSVARRARREAIKEFNEYIKIQVDSEDLQEGIRALKENREPQFKGK